MLLTHPYIFLLSIEEGHSVSFCHVCLFTYQPTNRSRNDSGRRSQHLSQIKSSSVYIDSFCLFDFSILSLSLNHIALLRIRSIQVLFNVFIGPALCCKFIILRDFPIFPSFNWFLFLFKKKRPRMFFTQSSIVEKDSFYCVCIVAFCPSQLFGDFWPLKVLRLWDRFPFGTSFSTLGTDLPPPSQYYFTKETPHYFEAH